MLTLVVDKVDLDRIRTPEVMQVALEAFKVNFRVIKEAEKRGDIKMSASFVNPPGGFYVLDTPDNDTLVTILATLPANVFVNREVYPLVPNDLISSTVLPEIEKQVRARSRD